MAATILKLPSPTKYQYTATAIPSIATEFHSLDAIGWYASSYFLTQMAFQPAFGSLFTLLPVKPVFITSLLLFELGSIVCAISNNSVTLITGRLIAGAGGAGIYVGTLTVIAHAVCIRQRPIYLSIVTSMFGVASVAGPLLGGVFTDSKTLTWRCCFWINLPIGFLAIIVFFFFFVETLPRPSGSHRPNAWTIVQSLNIPGVIVLLAAFFCLILALQWGGLDYAWSNSRILGCLFGFSLLIITFAVLQIRLGKESRSKQDGLLTQRASIRTLVPASSFLLFISATTGVLIYYLPVYFQAVRLSSATGSGIQNLPFLVTSLFSPLLSGALISVFGYYVPFLWVGSALATVGAGLLLTWEVDSGKVVLDCYQVLVGLGLGICTQVPFTAVQHKMPTEIVVRASAVVSFCNSLGPVLGTNIAQAIFVNSLLGALQESATGSEDAKRIIRAGPSALPSPVPVPVRHAFNTSLIRAFILPVACAGAAFCCSLAVEWGNVKKDRRERGEDPENETGHQ
ncbi:MAG: hypothetical protein M1831_001613 [Alyxoria varia]|nr:MAG: hypothetical protein M1831_001613 [Alyxoria varia]